jgi:hypothetical protein
LPGENRGFFMKTIIELLSITGYNEESWGGSGVSLLVGSDTPSLSRKAEGNKFLKAG